MQSHAKLASLNAIQGRHNTHFPVRRNLSTQKPDDFWFEASDNAIGNGNRVRIHSFERKLSALSNGVSCKRIGRELFDLKARGNIFFNHPVDRCLDRYTYCPLANEQLFYALKLTAFYLLRKKTATVVQERTPDPGGVEV